ncbi:MAG: PGPGW domain-containing protein [bacterium]
MTQKILMRVARIVVGVLLIATGLAGLALPILPGWLLIAFGVLLLARDIPFFARVRDWIGSKLPSTVRRFTGRARPR